MIFQDYSYIHVCNSDNHISWLEQPRVFCSACLSIQTKSRVKFARESYETYDSSRIRNQLGKLKISCTRPVKERQKLVSELCIGRNKTMRMANMRESRGSAIARGGTSTEEAAL